MATRDSVRHRDRLVLSLTPPIVNYLGLPDTLYYNHLVSYLDDLVYPHYHWLPTNKDFPRVQITIGTQGLYT